MIKSITVTNYLGDSIKLDLARPELSGFVVRSISGLGPGKANINITDLTTDDGGVYNSARLPARNIVISLKYLWHPTIEDVRQLSYKYFPIKKKVTLLIETDNRKAEIDGYVESNEPTIFSNSEGSDISIICSNPYFRSAGVNGKNITLLSGVEPTLEFPFGAESIIEMGNIENKTEQVVRYDGDAEVGITITIHALDVATNVAIGNTRTREIMRIDTAKLAALTGAGICPGDYIVICTEKGNKSITLQREGKTYNILNCLDKDADWFTLVKGDNIFACTAESGISNLQVMIENDVIYEGV